MGKRMKPNEWLVNQDFLARVNYHDMYYFKKLAKHIWHFLKTIPVHSITSYDPVHKRIYFYVGEEEKKSFEVDTDIGYWEFTILVDRWLSQFYPQYRVKASFEEGLSEEEIMEKVKKGMSLDEAVLMKKKVKRETFGIITKIVLTDDEFVLNVDGEEFSRMSGSLKKPMPLREFLKTLRKITSDKKVRKFIFDNSSEMKRVSQEELIDITHRSNRMFNFFVIHYPDLKDLPIQRVKIVDAVHEWIVYRWGRFNIHFDSENVRNDCLNYLADRRKADGIGVKDEEMIEIMEEK